MMNKAMVLQLSLHQQHVGYVVGLNHAKNILLFDPLFRESPHRVTLGLITHPKFPHSEKLLQQSWVTHQRLAPLLSNLLPEGALRQLLTQQLKIHIYHEFQLLSALGQKIRIGIVQSLYIFNIGQKKLGYPGD